MLKHLLVVSLIAANLVVTWVMIGLIGSGVGWQVSFPVMVVYSLSAWAMFTALERFWGFP